MEFYPVNIDETASDLVSIFLDGNKEMIQIFPNREDFVKTIEDFGNAVANQINIDDDDSDWNEIVFTRCESDKNAEPLQLKHFAVEGVYVKQKEIIIAVNTKIGNIVRTVDNTKFSNSCLVVANELRNLYAKRENEERIAEEKRKAEAAEKRAKELASTPVYGVYEKNPITGYTTTVYYNSATHEPITIPVYNKNLDANIYFGPIISK